MKLNFWQWLGLVLVVVAGGWLIYDWMTDEPELDGPVQDPPAQVEPAEPSEPEAPAEEGVTPVEPS